MNFQQLRIIRETVRREFNLTEAANALHTSQSGVSKHIKDLEDELGVELFVRKGKRLLGLTEPGKELVVIVERILLDTENIKKLGEQFTGKDLGQLTVATTHTQARYALPRVITRFKSEFPKVSLVLHEASPSEIVSMLQSGQADIGIATEALQQASVLVSFPFYSWHHGVVVPKSHTLATKKSLTLEDLADWPIVTYQRGFTGRPRIDQAFEEAGLVPDIAMTALDADVLKTYVELGLGVGIVASMAFSKDRDPTLTLLDAGHLFAECTSLIAVRRGAYFRRFAYRFIELCAPSLTEPLIRQAIGPGAGAGE
jgi:LysR family cys regulon transcriptional activator